jgi:hypothetical protein
MRLAYLTEEQALLLIVTVALLVVLTANRLAPRLPRLLAWLAGRLADSAKRLKRRRR